ncbi:uncharacterized protein GGS25DRAFT_503768 [Hypoxylon fragiforme]|uniref:uncharacterized protein n=1 Tax=Hypoxylon fragiforme TaxID=63214 RepID=UPI0020C62017|nr:uncharacterized protein GGS25DRAFT_503768 [Hypoxylon fragiforme]KAI2605130.1 hypothetical protein GGS25DRAFT_503768 [Hypoxylon fragiforme]
MLQKPTLSFFLRHHRLFVSTGVICSLPKVWSVVNTCIQIVGNTLPIVCRVCTYRPRYLTNIQHRLPVLNNLRHYIDNVGSRTHGNRIDSTPVLRFKESHRRDKCVPRVDVVMNKIIPA